MENTHILSNLLKRRSAVMKPYKVYLEFSSKKVITVVAESERDAAREALNISDKLITPGELMVEARAVDYNEEEE